MQYYVSYTIITIIVITFIKIIIEILFLSCLKDGSREFILEENPEALGHYRIKTRVSGDEIYLTPKQTRSRKKIITMQRTRLSTYAFTISN